MVKSLAIFSDWFITKFVWNFYRDAGDSLNDCRIMFVTEIYKIEEPGSSDGPGASSDSPLKSESDFSTEHTLWFYHIPTFQTPYVWRKC